MLKNYCLLSLLLICLVGCRTSSRSESQAIQSKNNQESESVIIDEEVTNPTEENMDKLVSEITEAVESAKDIDELTIWLKEHQTVSSVELKDYEIKTFPPRKEYVLALNTTDELKTYSLTVAVDGNQLGFIDLRPFDQ